MKVNDYVRTEYGIDKIIGYRYEAEYENGHVLWFEKSDSGGRFTDKDLPKSSPNIIDLIEVGDYVNGQLVKHIAYFEGVEEPIKKLVFVDEHHLIPTEVCEQNEIKSIVTKEQFESMEYKVGD